MNEYLKRRLFELDNNHKERTEAKCLRVFYGWAKVGKIRKKEAISIIFENDHQRDERTMRAISKFQKTVYVRQQTEQEKRDAVGSIRMFSEYSIFLSDKKLQGSLEMALKANSDADQNHISQDEREAIAKALRAQYLKDHPTYKEPIIQLQINFENG